MKMNEIYEAPVLEVLNVMVEQGFAGSLNPGEENEEGGITTPNPEY
jgi:hypothetical protein